VDGIRADENVRPREILFCKPGLKWLARDDFGRNNSLRGALQGAISNKDGDLRILLHYALLLSALWMSISVARCMLGSECNGGRCNLDVGLGTGKTAQPNQRLRVVARNTVFVVRGAKLIRLLRSVPARLCGEARKLHRSSKNGEAEQLVF